MPVRFSTPKIDKRPNHSGVCSFKKGFSNGNIFYQQEKIFLLNMEKKSRKIIRVYNLLEDNICCPLWSEFKDYCIAYKGNSTALYSIWKYEA